MSKAAEHNTVTYIIEGLDCANCAAKIERKIQAMPQIDEATLTFATKQLRVTSPETDKNALKSELESVCLSVEDGVSLHEKGAGVPARKKNDELLTVTYTIEGLDCANCAAKIERKIQAMPQIDEATLTFATKQLKVTSTQSDSSMLKSELMTALQPALATLSAKKIQYYEIPAHTLELSDALNDVLSKTWKEKRGIEVFSFNINSLSIPDDQRLKLTEWEENAMTTNPNTAAARLVGGQIDAMKVAANNNAGAMTGFMGMGMAMNAGGMGGMNAQNLFAMGQQQNQAAAPQPAQPQAAAAPQPAAGSWTCKCGATATGKFCPECGSPKPADSDGWTCSCGTVNKGKFCQNCGAKRPVGAPLYRCDKCGWEPEDPAHPPKFCPECGDPFDDGDITN